MKLQDNNFNAGEGDENGGFNPKWDLLVKKTLPDGSKGSKGSRGSRSSLQLDEEDVGSSHKVRSKHTNKNLGDTKRNWIKATYNQVTKRLYSAPYELEELKIALWMRFGKLRDNF